MWPQRRIRRALVNFMKKCLPHRMSLVVFLVAGLWYFGGAGSASAQVGVPADPSMKLQGLDGRVYDIADQRGNVVLVSFGATWCAPCTTELKALEELLVEYRDQPVKFFWVSIERPEEVTNSALKRYAKERKVSFPVLRDTAKMVFLQFSPRVRLPMVVFLGKDGKVDGTAQFGMRSPADAYKADLRARLNKLLKVGAEADR
jgi:peroxiredoxin